MVIQSSFLPLSFCLQLSRSPIDLPLKSLLTSPPAASGLPPGPVTVATQPSSCFSLTPSQPVHLQSIYLPTCRSDACSLRACVASEVLWQLSALACVGQHTGPGTDRDVLWSQSSAGLSALPSVSRRLPVWASAAALQHLFISSWLLAAQRPQLSSADTMSVNLCIPSALGPLLGLLPMASFPSEPVLVPL